MTAYKTINVNNVLIKSADAIHALQNMAPFAGVDSGYLSSALKSIGWEHTVHLSGSIEVRGFSKHNARISDDLGVFKALAPHIDGTATVDLMVGSREFKQWISRNGVVETRTGYLVFGTNQLNFRGATLRNVQDTDHILIHFPESCIAPKGPMTPFIVGDPQEISDQLTELKKRIFVHICKGDS